MESRYIFWRQVYRITASVGIVSLTVTLALISLVLAIAHGFGGSEAASTFLLLSFVISIIGIVSLVKFNKKFKKEKPLSKIDKFLIIPLMIPSLLFFAGVLAELVGII